MPTPTKGPRLGGSPAHERIILANLASQLFEHGKITTTETKAKRMRPLVEKLITKAKRGDLHNRRQVMSVIRDKGVVHSLFTEIAPSMEGRNGGYVRITKVGNRKGDNAPMAVIEIITESIADTQAAKAKVAKKAEKASAKAEPKKADDSKKSDEPKVAAFADVPAEEPKKEYANSFRGTEAPEGFTVKGNEDSMKYHTPESPYYDATIAEIWFKTAEDAEAAGFESVKNDAGAVDAEAK